MAPFTQPPQLCPWSWDAIFALCSALCPPSGSNPHGGELSLSCCCLRGALPDAVSPMTVISVIDSGDNYRVSETQASSVQPPQSSAPCAGGACRASRESLGRCGSRRPMRAPWGPEFGLSGSLTHSISRHTAGMGPRCTGRSALSPLSLLLVCRRYRGWRACPVVGRHSLFPSGEMQAAS